MNRSTYDDFMDDASQYDAEDTTPSVTLSLVEGDWFATDMILSPHQVNVLFWALAEDSKNGDNDNG